MPTDARTDAKIVVPAHAYDISFVGVSPSYSAVTDASDHGYLFRMRQRTQRIDLTEPAESPSETEKKAETDAGNNKQVSSKEAEHSLIFEYRAAPTLDFHSNSSEVGDVSLASPTCKHFAVSEEGSDSTSIDIADAPQWRLQSGSLIAVKVTASEMLRNDQGDELGMCTHVHGDIHLHTRLGLTTEEAGNLDMDSETLEHKEVKKLLDKSMGVTNEAEIEEMRTCIGVEDDPDHPNRNCNLPIQLSETTTIRNFRDSYRCEGKDSAGFTPLGESAKADAKERLEMCRQAWKPLLAGTQYRVWASLAWDETQGDELGLSCLSKFERAAWSAVGVTRDHWTADWSTYTEFSTAVMTVVPAWADLSLDATKMLEEALHFTEETWGRLWALRDRVIPKLQRDAKEEPSSSLSWNELSIHEVEHLQTLGWVNETWDDIESASPESSSTAWEQLECEQKLAARALGFWAHTWPAPGDPGMSQDDECSGLTVHKTASENALPWAVPEDKVHGCFYDASTMRVVLQRTVPGPTATAKWPRFSTLCERTTFDNAHVTKSLRIGLPGRSAATSMRALTATMHLDGHPLVVKKLVAAIEGERFITDKEAVPYPQGSPLLVLHDPPGGASSSSFSNVHVESVVTTKGSHVTHGFVGNLGASLGYEAELLKMSMCAGLGVYACMDLSPDGVAFNIKGGLSADTATNFETGRDESSLQPKLSLDVEFSYSTSDDPGSAGPMAVSFCHCSERFFT